MDKDHKLIAMLIPIILVLSLVLYVFPGYSNFKTDISSPIINQTNNSSINESSTNSSSLENQNNQISQQGTQSNYNNYPSNQNSNTNSNSGNSTDESTNPDVPVGPIEPSNDTII